LVSTVLVEHLGTALCVSLPRISPSSVVVSMLSKKSKRRGQNSKGVLALLARGPPVGATSYSGPIVPRPLTLDLDTYVRRFVTYGGVTTPGISGQIQAQYPNSPAGYSEFSAVGALYQEYRTLAQRVRWIPQYINFVGSATYVAVTHGPMVFSVNRNAGAGPPAGAAAALNNTDAILGHTQTRMSIDVRAGTAQEMLFLVTSTPQSTWTTCLTTDSILSTGTTYGYFEAEVLVQFRNTV